VRDEVRLAVTEELTRRAQLTHPDALFERMVQLLDARRHFLEGAAVNDGHIGAETTGRARRIHGRVATADDKDLLATRVGQRSLVLRIDRAHQVHARQEFVRGHHTEQVLTRHVHERRQACAGADEDLPEPRGLEVFERRRLADDEIAHEASAEQRDLAHHVVDQVVRQAKLGNAVAQHATEFVERLEDRDRETFRREQVRVDQARRA
jgi:hypothetical protein